MKDYQTLKIKSHFVVEVLDDHERIILSDEAHALVEKTWQEELKKRELYNGELLSAVSYDKEKLTGVFFPYKLFIAKIRNPSFKIKMVPVSVSGLILHGDNVLIGQRSNRVTEFPGCYELPPSGSIGRQVLREGRIDLKEQLAIELFEEVGITPKKIKKIQFFMLAHDKEQDHIDLCAEIKISPFALQSVSGEYSQIMTIPKNELPDFVNRYSDQFVPLSIMILKLKKLI